MVMTSKWFAHTRKKTVGRAQKTHKLLGCIDGMKGPSLCGWAAFEGVEESVEISLIIDGKTVKHIIADEPDPALAFLGSINHRFKWTLPEHYWDGKPHNIVLHEKSTGKPIGLGKLTIGPDHYDLTVDQASGGILRGWIIERQKPFKPTSIEVFVDDISIGQHLCNKIRADVKFLSAWGQRCGFEIKLPTICLDGLRHKIRIAAGGNTLYETYCISRIDGYIDELSDGHIRGWIQDMQGDGTLPLTLDLYIDNHKVTEIKADQQRPDLQRPCGFDTDISRFTVGLSHFKASLKISNTNIEVLGGPLYFYPKYAQIELLHQLGCILRGLSGDSLIDDHTFFCRHLLPDLISAIRHDSRHQRTYKSPSNLDIDPSKVSVIIPVYDGFEETVQCLYSAIESRQLNRTDYELIVIDDRGPNQEIHEFLKKVSASGAIKLIQNDTNLGFVKSVNKALKLCEGRDVVLLNADAVVHGDWLDRLHAAAYSESSIASVTPFSNNATICSYPEIGENGIPVDTSPEELDTICREVNRGVRIEIPTGVGFCMYMRADAINDIGVLDEGRWGHGYCEENDWCIRANDRGWKHLLSADTFVEHIGGVSFGKNKKNSLVEQNLKILETHYPEYSGRVHHFIATDPMRNARNKITVTRMRQRLVGNRHNFLYVTHGIGGGIEVHCTDMVELLKREAVEVIFLEGDKNQEIVIRYAELSARYRTEELDLLIEALQTLSISLVHFHSDIDLDTRIWKLPQHLQVPYDITLHDYQTVCPRVNFVDASGSYCGEPKSISACNFCIDHNGVYPGLANRYTVLQKNVATWRNFYQARLAEARKVFAPNADVAERVRRYFPEITVDIKPHPLLSATAPQRIRVPPRTDAVLEVAVIGAIGPHKGFNQLLACVKDAFTRDLPLRYTVIGYTCGDNALLRYPNIEITGRYDIEDLHDILVASPCSVALFLSQWPETYSYTLTEALRAGLYPISLDIGAIADRIRSLEIGTVINFLAPAQEINDAALMIRNSRSEDIYPFKERDYTNLMAQYYEFEA